LRSFSAAISFADALKTRENTKAKKAKALSAKMSVILLTKTEYSDDQFVSQIAFTRTAMNHNDKQTLIKERRLKKWDMIKPIKSDVTVPLPFFLLRIISQIVFRIFIFSFGASASLKPLFAFTIASAS